MMSMFVGGILMTFAGVATLSSGHGEGEAGEEESSVIGEPVSPPTRKSTASQSGARSRYPSLHRGTTFVVPVFIPGPRIPEWEPTTRRTRASTSEAMPRKGKAPPGLGRKVQSVMY